MDHETSPCGCPAAEAPKTISLAEAALTPSGDGKVSGGQAAGAASFSGGSEPGAGSYAGGSAGSSG